MYVNHSVLIAILITSPLLSPECFFIYYSCPDFLEKDTDMFTRLKPLAKTSFRNIY